MIDGVCCRRFSTVVGRLRGGEADWGWYETRFVDSLGVLVGLNVNMVEAATPKPDFPVPRVFYVGLGFPSGE